MGTELYSPHTEMTPVCLITGGAGRLGSALARALIGSYDIAAVYRTKPPRFPSQLRTPIDLAGEAGPARRAFCVQGDLARKEDIRRIVEVVLARFGQIDVVINSAADTRYHGRLLELSFDTSAVEQQLLTNCVAPMSLVSAIFQESWKNQRVDNRRFNRCVVNISSISGLCVFPSAGQAFYSASKAALNFLTMHLAYELADYSIRANAVCPSRFPDSIPAEKVVRSVSKLIESRETGQVMEVSSESE